MASLDNRGWLYAEEVVKGNIQASEILIAACKRALDDKKNAEKRGYYYDPESANRVIQFFTFLKHIKETYKLVKY